MSRNSNHPYRKPLHRSLFVMALSICGLLVSSTAYGAICNSQASGPFNAIPWSCGTPTSGDDLFIGHAVTSSNSITAQSVTVLGSGVLTMQGFSLQITVGTLEVQPGGILQGASGTVGSTVYITAPTGVGLNVFNNGQILGGNPGGHIFIHDGGPGGDLPCPNNSLIESNAGIFLGGTETGNVYMLAENVSLLDTVVEGGSGFVNFNILGHSIAGSVYITGLTVDLNGATTVTSGTNNNPAGIGGSVKIVAQSCNSGDGDLTIGPGVVVGVGGPSSGGCPGALVYGVQTNNIAGSVAAGPAGCLYWDPPKLNLIGDAELTGGTVILAGSDLDATGLASRTLPTPAVDAVDTLEINLNPGGAFDLQGLTPGFPYFRAGSQIILRADQVLLDPGVGLEDLMEPPPDWLPGAPTLMLTITPDDSQQFVSPGSIVEFPVQITNISTVAVYVEVWIEDSLGWLAGGGQHIIDRLDPGEAINRTLTLNVPLRAKGGRHSELKVSAGIEGKEPQVMRAAFIMND